jgi:hypothetical protein
VGARDKAAPDEGDYRWLCPTCFEQETGSAPLRR